MPWTAWLATTLGIWLVQTVVIFFAIAICVTTSDSDMGPGDAFAWAAFWPIRGLPRVIHWLFIGFMKTLVKVDEIVMAPHYRRLAIARRCDEQGVAYLKGLLEEDEESYNLGLYGDFQPKEVA